MRIETAAARGRPPSGRVERRARAATRGGGLTIDVLAYGIDSGAFSTAAATGAAPVCSSTALRQTAAHAAAAFLELQSPTVADAFIHGACACAPLVCSCVRMRSTRLQLHAHALHSLAVACAQSSHLPHANERGCARGR